MAGDALGGNSMSSTFDVDLAKANLLRVRAEYRKAEDICLNILRTYPNSAATHTLLGDICSDQGRLEQAAEWYELSLDLDPNSQADQQKLDDIRDQINERDHISAVAQLGLPKQRVSTPTWTITGITIVILMAICLGYAIRYGRIGDNSQPQVIDTPIRAGKMDVVPVNLPQDTLHPKSSAPILDNHPLNSPVPPVSTIPKDDQELQDIVAHKSKWGPRLISIKQDMLTKITTVVFSWPEGENEREIGSDLAKTVLESTPDPSTIILRAMRKDKLMYQAEVSRDKYDETQTDEWQQQAASPDAWIDYILTNELYGKAIAEANQAAAAGASGETPPPASSDASAATGDGQKQGSKDPS
jgi:tetratricopeptide (TPR) repeat protein